MDSIDPTDANDDRRNRRGWQVALAGLGINLCIGVLYAWSVFAQALIDQLGWTKTAASGPYTTAIILFALVMVPAGRLTETYSPCRMVRLGGLLTGGGMILSGLAQSPIAITAAFGLITGAGLGLAFSATITSAVQWFEPRRQGLVAGMVVSGFALAAVYIAPLTRFLLPFGIQRAFFIEGTFFLLAIVLLAHWICLPVSSSYIRTKDRNGGQATGSGAGDQRSAGESDYDWPEMLQTRTFYFIWVSYVLGTSAGLMIIGHLSKIVEIQAGASSGFVMVALLALANAGGRVLSGWMGDKIGRRPIMLLVYLVQTGNLILFARYHSLAGLAIGTLLAGYCYGSLASLFPSITYDYFGTRHAGINYGLVFTAWGVGGIIGPILAGVVADQTGTYQGAYPIAAALCALGALLIHFIRPPQYHTGV